MNLIEQRRIIRTPIPGPKSLALHERRLKAVPKGMPAVLPAYIERAEGAILLDVDGNQIIDFGSGIAVLGVGHSAPEVTAAVREQMDAFTHTCFAISPYEAYVEVAERLNELTPGAFEKRTVLVNSGSEAVENAVKIARNVTGRSAIIAFEHAYHGRTNLTMALTAKNMPYKQGFGPFAGEIHRARMAYPYRWPTGPENCLEEAFEAFVALVHGEVGEQNTAAVIIEPIQGEAGFIVPPAGFLTRLAEFCRANGVVFIADEVQTGFCRTGDWFACDYEGVEPDLIVTGKSIAAGLPLSAVTGRAELMDAVHPGGLGGTFGGNPAACRAALANFQIMETENLNGRARAIGETMVARFTTLGNRTGVIGEVRGRGAMIAMELVLGPDDKTPNTALAAAVAKACHADGLLVMTTGAHRNSLRLLPPLTITDGLLSEGLDILEGAFMRCAHASHG
jgi:4-aminobutyrate aminotransferase/(S)-3-amino-2-methylpropionate transaminase